MKKIVLVFCFLLCVFQINAQAISVLNSPVSAANITYNLNNSGSFQYTTIESKDAGTDAYFSSSAVNSANGQYQIYRNNGFWKIGHVICNGCTSPSISLYYQTFANTSKPPCANNWIPVGGGGNLNLINISGDCIASGPTSVKSTTVLPNALSLPQLTAPDITNIAVPTKGMLVFDLTNNCLKLYNGTAWVCISTN